MNVREQVQDHYGQRITQEQGCCVPKVETGRVGALEGSDAAKLEKFRVVRDQIGARVQGWVDELKAQV